MGISLDRFHGGAEAVKIGEAGDWCAEPGFRWEYGAACEQQVVKTGAAISLGSDSPNSLRHGKGSVVEQAARGRASAILLHRIVRAWQYTSRG